MRPFVTAKEMANLDFETMTKLGISSFELMDRVSSEIVSVLEERMHSGDLVLILCGPGNNGGDGYRVAEKLRELGKSVSAMEVLPASSEDCKKAREVFRGKFVSEIPKKIDW